MFGLDNASPRDRAAPSPEPALERGVARLTRVQLGHRGESNVEILGGLQPGSTVAVHPGDRIKDGVAVAMK